jgi:hypothetical protein
MAGYFRPNAFDVEPNSVSKTRTDKGSAFLFKLQVPLCSLQTTRQTFYCRVKKMLLSIFTLYTKYNPHANSNALVALLLCRFAFVDPQGKEHS